MFSACSSCSRWNINWTHIQASSARKKRLISFKTSLVLYFHKLQVSFQQTIHSKLQFKTYNIIQFHWTGCSVIPLQTKEMLRWHISTQTIHLPASGAELMQADVVLQREPHGARVLYQRGAIKCVFKSKWHTRRLKLNDISQTSDMHSEISN